MSNFELKARMLLFVFAAYRMIYASTHLVAPLSRCSHCLGLKGLEFRVMKPHLVVHQA